MNNDDHAHAMFKQQMEELQAEREALFGFTEEDQANWTNVDHNHKHSAQFMEQVHEARRRQEQQEQQSEPQPQPEPERIDDNENDSSSDSSSQDPDPKSILDDDNDNNNDNDDNTVDSKTESVPVFTHLTTTTNRNHDDRSSRMTIQMVNVGSKPVTERRAVAESRVRFPNTHVWMALTTTGGGTNNHQQNQSRATTSGPSAASPSPLTNMHHHANHKEEYHDLVGPKGPIFQTAKLAGIMAAKKTSDLIPLCHPLPLSWVNVDITLDEATKSAVIRCECRVSHQTGVEMEALTGASVAALTIYDMCKAVSHDICIEGTRLVQKSGGKRLVDHDQTNSPE
ncbi:hypothetical protein ACA910_004062 [Epithemia clementina (nom. ined.)]